ncbi:MAG TPA: DUF2809 domain-containing protein [Polyangiales bacterium]|nr:DUF2809 domain-containing protein [Polyangiales bacterium]
MRISRKYLLLTLALFAVELSIALWVHDGFIRPFVGDVLVVVLVYCAVRSFLPGKPVKTALGVFAFACAVELAQYFQLVARLHLEHNAILRTVIGTHADPLDVLAYALGTLLIIFAERFRS